MLNHKYSIHFPSVFYQHLSCTKGGLKPISIIPNYHRVMGWEHGTVCETKVPAKCQNQRHLGLSHDKRTHFDKYPTFYPQVVAR